MRYLLELEKTIQRSPLGLRFVDLVQGVTISDGLLVTSWLKGTPGPRQQAVVSPLSGIYSFHSLPGLRRFEAGESPTPNGQAADFIVFIEDRFRRFLPQIMVLHLPRETLLQVSLFSSTARAVPVGLGVVRGELATHKDTSYTGPASWAMITALVETRTYVGIADERGMFNIFIPYASALPPLVGGNTFPHGNKPVDQLSWPVTLRVFYQAEKPRLLPDPVPPDTLSILGQRQASISEEVGKPLPELASMIRFGGDLIVKTKDQTRLFIDEATNMVDTHVHNP